MFELGARPHPPRDLFRAYLHQSDVFIGLYWQSYGRISPGMEVSGLEEEFELSRELPRLLYIKEPAPDREPRLTELLSQMRPEASYRRFRSSSELDQLVRDDLATLLSERFVAGRPAPDGAGSGPSQTPPGQHSLPVDATSLIGREREVEEVARLIELPNVRLVTLTGPGGVGKTRLAVAAGERLRHRLEAGIVFVGLETVTESDQVAVAIGRAVEADLRGTGSALVSVIERLDDDPWLLILDNLEQAHDAAHDIDELLMRCPGVAILATSRLTLQLRAEREFPVPPLPLPSKPVAASVDELASSPAVALFVDRARAVRPDFSITVDNAAAVAEICRRLEGLPLAIELAAARTRLLDPEELLSRLGTSLDSLGTGAVDLPQRQRTLRATVEWSVDLLDDAERSLLESMAAFVDGWTIEAAAAVAALEEDRALEVSEALARHSLIYLDSAGPQPRSRMLDTIGAFVAERLDARPDVNEVRYRQADYYRTLALQADRPLRTVGHSEWLERLEEEAGNLAASVRWYLDHDTEQLPRMFRVLWLFWELREHMREAHAWTEQLLGTADSLSPHARAELLWVDLSIDLEIGDDDAALAARKRLAPLLEEIGDPFLHAASQLAIGWSSPIVGDFDGGLRRVLVSLDEFSAMDEPYLTALTSLSAGGMETAVGRYEDAQRHLREGLDLANRYEYPWLAAWSLAQLSTVALIGGDLDEARTLLAAGLEISLAVESARNVSLFLTGFARLAFATGNPERAALLAGAAEGLRQRVGLRAWPMLRRGEDELVAQVRETLGESRFEESFGMGLRLNQRDAVAVVRVALGEMQATSSPRQSDHDRRRAGSGGV